MVPTSKYATSTTIATAPPRTAVTATAMDPVTIEVEPHPLLALAAFTTDFGATLEERPSPLWLVDLLRIDAPAPVHRDEALRQRVRDLLRHGGYKPTGRGKPASEYLVRAATEGKLGSINPAVDACNVVSLHSGLPISVVDLARVTPPLSVGVVRDATSYVFNNAGQSIDVEGLLCLADALGPCANAVKDSQRTKTDGATRRTLTLVWAPWGPDDRTEWAPLGPKQSNRVGPSGPKQSNRVGPSGPKQSNRVAPWGPNDHTEWAPAPALRDAVRWYRALLARVEATTLDVYQERA